MLVCECVRVSILQNSRTHALKKLTNSFFAMQKLKVTLVKSPICRPKDQKATVIAIGIRRMNGSVVVEANSAMVGMIEKVKHLVKVEEFVSA